MPATTAQIIETPRERLPFKVVFSKNGSILAERVGSLASGHRLIANLLPLLQKHEDA